MPNDNRHVLVFAERSVQERGRRDCDGSFAISEPSVQKVQASPEGRMNLEFSNAEPIGL